MKKFTSLLVTLCCSFTMFAQLPNGTIAPNFTATDINGNSHNLYHILDQGKTVILDFSATWVAPSWAYHNTNVLQDFYDLHGPSGDNSAMVLFIESDTSTNVDCITNLPTCTGTSSLGDWTAGKTYPFIDDFDGSIGLAFGVTFYPTIYMICSDKKVSEIGQPNLTQLEALAITCPTIIGSTKLLRGTVVKDDNADCVADANELPLPSWGVYATGVDGTTLSTITNSSGDYRLYIDSTNAPYTLAFIPPNSLWMPCPPPPPVVVTGIDTITVDFAAEPYIDCPQLGAQISTPLLRRCFNNQFFVEVCNNGTITANNAYVDVTLPSPEFLTASSATLPYTTISPGVYRFDLGDLSVGTCVNFNLVAELSCDSTVIGQTLCYEAHAYPDTLCRPINSLWNGSNVTVDATCVNGTPNFTITNTGTAGMPVASNYIIIEDDVMREEGTFQLNTGESLPISVQGNGSTWRIEATQVPYHPVPNNPSIALEGCSVSGNVSLGFVLAFPTYDPSSAYDIECMEVIGSWDPNDKTGYPLGATSQNLISKNTDIDYHIRFQNTGNDTAFNIVVRDTLSTAVFNPRTIQLGASSHPYEYTLENDNVMVFKFNDIKLVDSFANEPLSHGFLDFKISQYPNLPDGTELTNSAAIYFDFNEPVITNTTMHRVGEVPHVTRLKNAFNTTPVEVYPNPLNGALQLNTGVELPNGTRWTLFDFSGKKVAQGIMDGQTATIGNTLKNSGVYHIEFSTKNGRSLGGATLIK